MSDCGHRGECSLCGCAHFAYCGTPFYDPCEHGCDGTMCDEPTRLLNLQYGFEWNTYCTLWRGHDGPHEKDWNPEYDQPASAV